MDFYHGKKNSEIYQYSRMFFVRSGLERGTLCDAFMTKSWTAATRSRTTGPISDSLFYKIKDQQEKRMSRLTKVPLEPS